MTAGPVLVPDAEMVLGIAATAIPFARSAEAEAERWLRVLRLHGEVGVALQALGVSEVPLAVAGEGVDRERNGRARAGDRDAVALLQRLEQLRVDAQRMIERGENPTPEMEQQLDQLLGTIQSKPIYQAAVTSQDNFDKIMARVNNWILDGIKRGAASPIITLG